MPIGIYKHKRGKDSPRWRGGRINHTEGYILVHNPKHPNCDHHGYVMEHRLVMEKYLCRYLSGIEKVHHINGIKNDNRIKNLQLFSNLSKHIRYHQRLNANWKKVKDKWFKPCNICKRLLEVNKNNWYFRRKEKIKSVVSPCKKCSCLRQKLNYYKCKK